MKIHLMVFERYGRIGDWKYLQTNYSYTWPVPLEHPNYETKGFVPTYSPPEKDTTINRLDNWPKLYNLKVSPSESYNLSTRNQKQVEQMDRVITEFRNDFLSNPRGWVDNE